MAAPSCPANVRETKIAFGKEPQADLATANTTPELWSLTKTNPALATVTPNTETNANDIGKGDEFATEVYPTSMDVSVPLEKFISSEFLAWLFCFSTGSATKTPAGTGFKYAAVPSDPAVACINLPAFSVAEQIRTPPDAVVDREMVGLVVQDFTITLESGPGRANARVTTTWVGTGKTIVPSGVTPFPAVTAEHFLNAASATINIGGIDYVLNQTFISLTFSLNNNVRLDSGYYPGSGVDANGFAIRGRMEYGTRDFTLSFVARAIKGSPEFVALVNQTPGTAVITLTGGVIGAGPEKHKMEINIPEVRFSAVTNGDADGIVTVECTAMLIKKSGQPLLTMSATTGIDAIFGL